ncbi:MAG: NYN domain-containing protein [Chloroflexi bacterium]|nr:NYN domain-containing protein [Chloroflexota bacterium]
MGLFLPGGTFAELSIMAKRVIVFIDEQNVYKAARRAFFEEHAPIRQGNFFPMKLANLLCSRLPIGVKQERVIKEVRVYTAMPSSAVDPRSYVPHSRRCESWKEAGLTVIDRPLKYPRGNTPGEQKGLDVALAVDFVTLAIDDEYDIGIMFSTDTDLKPALEFVVPRASPEAEVACWWSTSAESYLSVSGLAIWSHRLTEDDYKSVCDYTDYNW